MTGNQKKHLLVQLLRDLSRIAVLALVIGVVYLSLYTHYRAAKAMEDDQFLKGVNGTVLKMIDEQVADMENPQEFLDGFKGTLWSMHVAGIDISDPLAAAEMAATSHSIYWPLWVSILIPVVATVLLGRVFCSWMCPAGLLFEWSQKLRKLLRLAEIKPGEVQFSHKNKYAVLLVGLIMAAIFGLPLFALIYPPAVISRLAHAWIFGTAVTGMLVILGVIVAMEVFVSPRWWCRTMCPGGAIFALLSKFRLVRVKVVPSKCTGCRDCEPICPMGIYPVQKATTIECDSCGLCIRHCPDDALVYAVSLPVINRRSGGNGPKRRKTSKNVAAALLVILISLLSGSTAEAHHILGLPHYSYKENYPQAPTLEYPATTGPYDVLMTSYPGTPVPGETANVAFYIKDRNNKSAYGDTVQVRVLQTSTFGDNTPVLPPTTVQSFDKTHKVSVNFPAAGEYVVELTLMVEGQTEVIPFLMVAGNPSAAPSVLITIGISLGLFLVVVRAIKIKRRRAQTGKELAVDSNEQLAA